MKVTHLDYTVVNDVIYPLLFVDQDLLDYFIEEDLAGRIELKFIPRRRKKSVLL
ncbi:hypothetical protein IJ21_15380 [Paenibacillus sp. 32O-W]|uniref:hypothetical protein n=1 Tax=Paenibacillus sp. 32O-W TaxID=1695218 RepID=UPI0007228297|nr:hypothetical protein [Paenibacillus sp. 32O-W]ALS26942.1 hypothetical protein IJ21_15380 [Paenibacillus sp. 32O-W]